jgi:hypothetical protein
MLVGSNALATDMLTNIQDTVITLGNAIGLAQGQQAADSIQNLAVANTQNADNACYTIGNQALIANIAEIGHAWGDCGLINVSQGLATQGSQAQYIGDVCDPKTQGQNLGMAAEQILTRQNGPGGASGLHQIVLKEDQDAANAAGTMSESSAILGLQSSDLVGEACATGTVEASMVVATTQQQSSM